MRPLWLEKNASFRAVHAPKLLTEPPVLKPDSSLSDSVSLKLLTAPKQYGSSMLLFYRELGRSKALYLSNFFRVCE